MLSHEECLDYLKLLAKLSNYENKTHCQKLHIISRDVDFKNYFEFQSTLKKLPPKRIFKVSLRLMEKYCLMATPDPNNQYYFFTALNSDYFTYYGNWIGFDEFEEDIRIPCLVKAEQIVNGCRELVNPPIQIYVIENFSHFLGWSFHWHGEAIITKELAEKYFSSFFDQEWRICKNLDTKLIKEEKSYSTNTKSPNF